MRSRSYSRCSSVGTPSRTTWSRSSTRMKPISSRPITAFLSRSATFTVKTRTNRFSADKPRFTYKKRFSKTDHEHLHGTEQDKFLHVVANAISEHARGGPFTGLILLGHSSITQPLRRLLLVSWKRA